jgi:hypothetical protein
MAQHTRRKYVHTHCCENLKSHEQKQKLKYQTTILHDILQYNSNNRLNHVLSSSWMDGHTEEGLCLPHLLNSSSGVFSGIYVFSNHIFKKVPLHTNEAKLSAVSLKSYSIQLVVYMQLQT